MNKQSPNEVFCDLAVAVASALECEETAASLRDPLNEIASALIDQLSGGNTALELRALARVHTEICAETKKAPIN